MLPILSRIFGCAYLAQIFALTMELACVRMPASTQEDVWTHLRAFNSRPKKPPAIMLVLEPPCLPTLQHSTLIDLCTFLSYWLSDWPSTLNKLIEKSWYFGMEGTLHRKGILFCFFVHDHHHVNIIFQCKLKNSQSKENIRSGALTKEYQSYSVPKIKVITSAFFTCFRLGIL